jgi:ABC-type multidrug transport system permease subunit
MLLSLLIFWRPIAAPGLLFLYLVLGAGWTIATGVLVGLIAPDMKVATGLIQPIVTVPFSLMGIPWELIAPKVWTVLRFLPYRPALELARQAVLGGTAWVEPALVLAGWLVVTVGLAVWQVRKRGFLR